MCRAIHTQLYLNIPVGNEQMFISVHIILLQTEFMIINIDIGPLQNDPVVMGLLKSTMLPLQQVLEGNMIKPQPTLSSHNGCCNTWEIIIEPQLTFWFVKQQVVD